MAITDIAWIVGLGVVIMITLFMTFITYKDIETFFIFFAIFSAFGVWSGLLDIWILIINMIVLTLILINLIYRRKVVK